MTESTGGADPGQPEQQRPAPPLVAIVLGLTALIAVMVAAFAAPAVNSGAADLPLAVGGPAPAVAQVSERIGAADPDAFDITEMADRDEVIEAVEGREAIGGIVLTPEQVTIVIASGAGAPYANLLRGLGAGLAAERGVDVAYEDVAPLSADDAAGSGVAALGLPLMFGGIASGALLALAYRGPIHRRVRASAALSVLAGLSAVAIVQFGLGSFENNYLINSLAIATGIFAISLTVMGLALNLGAPGVGIGALTLLLVANPLSGLATGPQWLPSPWGDLGQLLPIGATGTALRSSAYFDGSGAGAAWIVLSAWVVVGLGLIALAGRRRSSEPTASTV